MREWREAVLYAAAEWRRQVGKRVLLILAVLALIVWIVQKTPVAFLPEDAVDFVGGAAIGLWIGVIVNWLAGRS